MPWTMRTGGPDRTVLAMLDKVLCEHLKKYHRGQENAASSKELEAAFHIKGTELRRLSHLQRRNRLLLCGAAVGGQGHRCPTHRAHFQDRRRKKWTAQITEKGGVSFGEEKRSYCPACGADRP